MAIPGCGCNPPQNYVMITTKEGEIKMTQFTSWTAADDAQQAIEDHAPDSMIRWTPAIREEMAEFCRLCPYYENGSKRGVGEYLLGVIARSGRSEETISYAWRTLMPDFQKFLAALK